MSSSGRPMTIDEEKDSNPNLFNNARIKSQRIQVISGRPYVVTVWDNGEQEIVPYGSTSGGSGGDEATGPTWAQTQSARQFGEGLSEDRRQFDERFGAEKARGDQQQRLAESTQRWREAVDGRDFEAAEFWKARSQELQQNQLAMSYTNMMAGLTGPRDWVKYDKLSRGVDPTPGSTLSLDQATPAWARGVTPGSFGGAQRTQAQSPMAGQSSSPKWAGGGGNLAGIPVFTPKGEEFYTDPRTATTYQDPSRQQVIR